MIVMISQLSFKLCYLPGQFLVLGDCTAQSNECPDNEKTSVDSTGRVQDACSHESPVLSKYQGIDRGIFQLFEVVTVCDNLRLFIFVQLKHEICWKTIHISADCLVQRFCRYSIEFGKIRINNNL